MAVYRSKIQKEYADAPWSITEANAPRGKDREILQYRLHVLTSADRAEPRRIGAMVAKMFLRFPQLAKGSPEQVEAYSRDLARFPEWAISVGIGNIINGLVLKAPEFPPTSLQVQQAVAEVLQPSLDEAKLISDVLTARIEAENPAMQADARKQIADAARAAMRKNAPPDTFEISKPNPKIRSKFDENRTAALDGPLHISDTLAAKLGIDRREQREDVA